jgi:hypothetical protein
MLRLRLASLALVPLFAAGCGSGIIVTEPSASAATAHVSGPEPTTDIFGNSRVTVRATGDGVSDSFTVTAGRYAVTYRIDAGTDSGCTFSLILTPSKDGPIAQTTEAILPEVSEAGADVIWTLAAGSYVLQEHETGALNCTRGFSATITAQN